MEEHQVRYTLTVEFIEPEINDTGDAHSERDEQQRYAIMDAADKLMRELRHHPVLAKLLRDHDIHARIGLSH
jgi:hypothetical protein